MKKTRKELSNVLFEKLGITQTTDLLGRKMEVSFFHKLDASWYFIEVGFVIQSCVLEGSHGFSASICFPWIPAGKQGAIFLSINTAGYLIQYRSPITADKPVQDEIQQFASDSKKNELSKAMYRLF